MTGKALPDLTTYKAMSVTEINLISSVSDFTLLNMTASPRGNPHNPKITITFITEKLKSIC